MKDELRELAGEMRNELCSDFAQKLEAILDAEGDGGAVEDNAQCSHCGAIFTRRDWAADNFDRPIPRCQFCGSSGAPQPVRTTETHPARSGVVRDEDVEAACAIYFGGRHWPHGVEEVELVRISMRAALEHFAKGSDEDVRDAAEIFAGTNAALSNLTVRKNNQEKTS